MWLLRCTGIFLLALGLVAGPWAASPARAVTGPLASARLVSQATPAPTVTGSPGTADEQPPGSWLLFILLIVCSMVGLLVLGVGAAVLLARLRERF